MLNLLKYISGSSWILLEQTEQRLKYLRDLPMKCSMSAGAQPSDIYNNLTPGGVAVQSLEKGIYRLDFGDYIK